MIRTLGWLIGIDNATSIDRIGVTFAAAWAQDAAFWLFLAVVAVMIGSLVFYWRFQRAGAGAPRVALALTRGLVLALLLLSLADPVMDLSLVKKQRPLLYLI